MLTPHMTALAHELARLNVETHYVAEEDLSPERRAMGWSPSDLPGVHVHIVKTSEGARNLVCCLPAHAVHITQGVRANGLVAEAQKQIISLRLRHYPIMERVDLRGVLGRIKPLIYALKFWEIAKGSEGLLAIGDGTPEWVARHAPKTLWVIPFAYFLRGREKATVARQSGNFRFIFVGNLITQKRVDLLIEAMSGLAGHSFELEIVGDGPERHKLLSMLGQALKERVSFVGTLPMDAAIDRIATADCLVLPSDQDGWGAVISEALINGTPAICSSACGAATAVRASGYGAVFQAGEVGGLRQALERILTTDRLSMEKREELAAWATCLTAETGALYLLDVIASTGRIQGQFVPPWQCT